MYICAGAIDLVYKVEHDRIMPNKWTGFIIHVFPWFIYALLSCMTH